jgi:hypothetical protein
MLLLPGRGPRFHAERVGRAADAVVVAPVALRCVLADAIPVARENLGLVGDTQLDQLEGGFDVAAGVTVRVMVSKSWSEAAELVVDRARAYAAARYTSGAGAAGDALVGAVEALPPDLAAAEVPGVDRRLQAVVDALADLVALKDGPRDDDYERRKPLAWQTARLVLIDALAVSGSAGG